MPSALEHLKVAKRYHFQGLTNEAIREYEAVLEIDPDNGDAIAGLRALGVEPTMRDDMQDGAVGHAGGLKTNFFTNQSKGSTSGGVTGKVFSYIVMALGIGGLYGLYVLAMYLMNYDNVTAKENVEVHFEKPKVKDNNAVVNVEVINLNPAPIKHMKISYRIADPTDRTLKEGIVELPGQVPAGDRRTFAETSLGEIKGVPAILKPKLEALVYGPKPKLKDPQIDAFMKAAAVKDKDALGDYETLVDTTEDFAPAFVGLGRAYAARGDMKEALKQYEKAEEIDPTNANAHYYSAVCHFYLGDKEKAKAEIEQAYQIAPDDPEIMWNQKYLLSMKEPKKPADAAKDKDKKDGDKKGAKDAEKK
jgi:tetratricopeptide (TPR) repeat protein